MTKDLSELKNQLREQYERSELQKYNFPTEIISLPSKGLLYPEDSPLRKGYIEMRYMTTQDEEILATPSLYKKGLALDKLFQSLIVTPIKYNDIVEADKDAIMVAARMLGYGPEYVTKCTCPVCYYEDKSYTFNLKDLQEKEFNPDVADMISPNLFKFVLPSTKREITFKLLTYGDMQKVDLELDAYNRKNPSGVNKEATIKLKHMIQSVDGLYDKSVINNFVDVEFFAKDAQSFREHLRQITPTIDFNVKFECKECLAESVLKLPIGIDFFWPGA